MKTIFLVHDKQESPAARQNFLEMAGYEVRLFRSGRELFLALQEQEPDVVLMDVLLEGKNGFEVCASMHVSRSRKFPVILCSRIYRGRLFQDEALNSGAIDYLLMPMNLDEFVSRVNDNIHRFQERLDGGLDISAA